MWNCSNIFLAFLIMALIIAVILALTIVTQKDEHIRHHKANEIRAAFFFAIAFALGFLVIIYQSKEKHMYQMMHHGMHHGLM